MDASRATSAIDDHEVITYDNYMGGHGLIGNQLKTRREALGLSQAEVARRAGTSAATLSRYEHGWTRFEIYTLRKLATALGCDLAVELRPWARAAAMDRDEALRRLARLFWDHRLVEDDLGTYPVWVFERVLEYGNLDDVRALRSLVTGRRFLENVARAERVSRKTRVFWEQILEREGMPCTRTYSRPNAWNS